jgi:hypothetical protein
MKKEEIDTDFYRNIKKLITEEYNSVIKDSYYKLLNGFKSQKEIEETCDNLKIYGISDEIVDYYKELAEIRMTF